MTGLLLLCSLLAGGGATLVLSAIPRISRRSLLARIGPYAPPGVLRSRTPGLLSADSFREVLRPVAETLGASAAGAAAGVTEPLSRRLERVHATADPAEFRLRQLGWAIASSGAAAVASLGLGVPPALGLLLLLAAPALAFLVLEQRLAAASAHWQHQVFHELPVVSEQLGMLLAAGYSPGTALQRLAERGHGCCSQDLRRVCTRIRHGLTEQAALDEWAQAVQVEGVHRLVGVLALSRDATDLSRLIAEEARALRRDAHRELLEAIERRAQQVWIPVTVATLVPGVVFLAVPFLEALRLFSGA